MLSPRLRDPLVAPESRLVELRELQGNVRKHEMETGLSYPIMYEIQEAIALAEQEKVAREESRKKFENGILERLRANPELHLTKYATGVGHDNQGRLFIICSACGAGVYFWSLHERVGHHRDEIGENYFRAEQRKREEVERAKQAKLDEEIRKVEAGRRFHDDMLKQSGKGLSL